MKILTTIFFTRRLLKFTALFAPPHPLLNKALRLISYILKKIFICKKKKKNVHRIDRYFHYSLSCVVHRH